MTDTIEVEKLVIDNKEYIFNGSPFSDKNQAAIEQIAMSIKNQVISLLCSVGTNSHCTNEYLFAQIDFFYYFLNKGIISSVDIVGADALQRYNRVIDHYSEIVAKIASFISTKITSIKFTKVENADEVKRSLIAALDPLKKVNLKKKGNITKRELVQSELGDFYFLLLDFIQQNQDFYNINQAKFDEIIKYIQHFDLYVLLFALKMTIEDGIDWHKLIKTHLVKMKYDNPNIRIIHWANIFGIYSEQQIKSDQNLLMMLRNDFQNSLREKKKTTSLNAYENFVLDKAGKEEFLVEERKIIDQWKTDLKLIFKRFSENVVNELDHCIITDEKQEIAFKKMESLYHSSPKVKRIGDNHAQVESGLIVTQNAFLARKEREAWVTETGFSRAFCEQSSIYFLLEEGGWLEAEAPIVFYPDPITPAISSILEISHNAKWNLISLKKIVPQPLLAQVESDAKLPTNKNGEAENTKMGPRLEVTYTSGNKATILRFERLDQLPPEYVVQIMNAAANAPLPQDEQKTVEAQKETENNATSTPPRHRRSCTIL